MNFDDYWDGACTADKVKAYSRKGVKGFVLGTNLLFGKKRPYTELINEVRDLLPKD